jgi:hypothetical protein
MSIAVALEALEADARLWEGASSVLGTAAWSAAGLTLTSMSLSNVAADVGLVGTYEEARARVERLLREGETELQTIATTLRQVKTAYESQDASQRASYDGLWEPEP